MTPSDNQDAVQPIKSSRAGPSTPEAVPSLPLNDTAEPPDVSRAAAQRSYFIGLVLLLGAAVGWSLSGALIKLVNRGVRTKPEAKKVVMAVKEALSARIRFFDGVERACQTVRDAEARAVDSNS